MPERPLSRIASPTELARVPANEGPPALMQQKRNHLAVLPKPCESLEARAGATFARTRKKVPPPARGHEGRGGPHAVTHDNRRGWHTCCRGQRGNLYRARASFTRKSGLHRALRGWSRRRTRPSSVQKLRDAEGSDGRARLVTINTTSLIFLDGHVPRQDRRSLRRRDSRRSGDIITIELPHEQNSPHSAAQLSSVERVASAASA